MREMRMIDLYVPIAVLAMGVNASALAAGEAQVPGAMEPTGTTVPVERDTMGGSTQTGPEPGQLSPGQDRLGRPPGRGGGGLSLPGPDAPGSGSGAARDAFDVPALESNGAGSVTGDSFDAVPEFDPLPGFDNGSLDDLAGPDPYAIQGPTIEPGWADDTSPLEVGDGLERDIGELSVDILGD